MTRSKGFSLIEMMIVLLLLSLALAASMANMRNKRKEQVLANLSVEYVNDLKSIDTAIRAFRLRKSLTWTCATNVPITVAELKTEGLLDASAATRFGASPRSPLGYSYLASGMKDCLTSKSSTVVYETGAAVAQVLKKAGMPADASTVMLFKTNVAKALLEKGLVSGTIAASSKTGIGASTSPWSRDLSSYIPTAPTQASVVLLQGFPVLDNSGLDPPEANPFNNMVDCEVVDAYRGCSDASSSIPCSAIGFTWSEPTCPSGKTKVTTFPACPSGGAGTSSGSVATPVQVQWGGSTTQHHSNELFECDSLCPSGGDSTQICERNVNATSTVQRIFATGGPELYTAECRQTGYATRYASSSGIVACGNPAYVERNPYYFRASNLTSTNQPRHVYCCRPGS